MAILGRLKGLFGPRPAERPDEPAVQPQGDETDALAQARAHLGKGNLAAARALLEPFASTTHRLDTLVLLARARISQGDLAEALSLLEQALVLHPSAPDLLETAAIAHEMKAQPVEALGFWQRLVFSSDTPSARNCIKWMRAYIRAAKFRQPRPSDVVSRVAALLNKAPDVTDDQKLEFAEWLYAYKPAGLKALEMYRKTSPVQASERDVPARWVGLAALAERSGYRLHRATPPDSDEVLLAALKHALVVPAFQWIPILEDGATALDQFVMHRMKTRRELASSPVLMSNKVSLELRLQRSPRVVDTPAMLLGGMPQFYHHTIEFLSALAVAELLQVGLDLPIVVNQELAPFQLEQLALLGYAEDRLIKVGADEQVLFRELLVPSRLVRGGQWMHPLIAQWHRNRFRVPMADSPAGSRLYLSRRLATRRRITNEVALIELLRAQGFTTIYPEDLGIAQQIALFKRASLVVSPAGAALANMVYMPEGGGIIALATAYALQSPGDTYFDKLAVACGHRFSWVECRPVEFVGERLIDSDMEVDLANLRKLIVESADVG